MCSSDLNKYLQKVNNPNPGLSSFTIKELKKGRLKKIVPGLENYGPLSKDFQNQKEMFTDNLIATTNDKKLVDYYKSLGFTDNNIMYHTSADIVHPNIKPIDTYHDGTAWSPVYKKPTQPVIYQPKPIIYQPNPTPQSTIDWLEGNNYPQELQPIQPEQVPVKPRGIVTDPRTNYDYRTRNGVSEYSMFGQREMAMGGSMPGATGFMYARVGGAPSNYRGKKTKPSAENGKYLPKGVPGEFEPLQFDPEEEAPFMFMGKPYEEPDRSREFPRLEIGRAHV